MPCGPCLVRSDNDPSQRPGAERLPFTPSGSPTSCSTASCSAMSRTSKASNAAFWWEGKFLMPWESHWMQWLVHKWVSREVDEEKSCQMYLTGQITIGQNKFTLTTTDFVAPPCHAPPNSSQHVSTLYPYLTGKMTPYEITTPPGDFIMKRTYRQKWYIFFWKRAHQMVYFANVQRFLQRRKKLSTPGKIYYVPVLYPLAYK